MKLSVIPIRLCLLAGLLLAPLSGCDCTKTKTGTDAASAPDVKGERSNVPPKGSGDRQDAGPKPDPKAEMGRPRTTPKEAPIPPRPLTEDELKTLGEWREGAAWKWEPSPDFKRQRPVGLIVLRPEGFEHTIPTALNYAGGLANASWDVKILLCTTGNDRTDVDALQGIREKLKVINAGLAARNKGEEGVKALTGVAPLRPIDDPVGFKSSEELEKAIKQWLGASFFGGHQFGPPARAPFGGISFSGHGRGVTDPANPLANPKAFQFQVTGGDWFDLSRLEAIVLRDYQAPVWILTDMCRGQEDVAKAGDAPRKDGPEKLSARAFKNLDTLPPAERLSVEAGDKLRNTTTAGGLNRHELGITALNATETEGRVVHAPENLLHHHIGWLLEPQIPADDVARPRFKNVPGTALTLAEVHAWANERYQRNGGKQRPGLVRGALSTWGVVYSPLRGKDVYQPLFPDLLAGQVSLTGGGFTVPELDAEPEHRGPVTLIRKQKDNANSDFKSIFEFHKPFPLTAGGGYRLALLVSARGPAAAKEIKFTVGVYTAGQRLLNSSFVMYGEAEAFKNPVKCDGSRRLISVPLTLANAADKPDAVSGFEIQAIPAGAETNWPQDAVLNVHAVYLLPAGVKDEQLKKDVERPVATSPLGRMCVWDIPLHETRPEAVQVQTDEKRIVLKQTVNDFAGSWGAAGAVYPKLYADRGGQQLRVKIEAAAGGAVADAAEVLVYACTHDRVLAARTMRLTEAAKGQVIPVTDSGLLSEIVVVVRNFAGSVAVTKLELENAPGR